MFNDDQGRLMFANIENKSNTRELAGCGNTVFQKTLSVFRLDISASRFSCTHTHTLRDSNSRTT